MWVNNDYIINACSYSPNFVNNTIKRAVKLAENLTRLISGSTSYLVDAPIYSQNKFTTEYSLLSELNNH